VKVHPKTGYPIHQLLSERTLQPRDVAVLYCLLEMTNPATGKASIRPSVLADKLNMRRPHMIHTISRLKKAGVLVNCLDPVSGEVFFRFCPAYVSVGSEKTRGKLWAQFSAAMDANAA